MWEVALYLLATLLLATLVHLVLSHRYKGRGPLYWWRWSRLVLEVWLEKASRRPWANAYDLSGTSEYEMCGIEATPFEKELEKPKPLTTDRHGDRMMLCGVDREGRAVVARIVRLTQRRASVFLMVVDHTGAVYTLPCQPDTNQVNVSGDGWRGAGLNLTCVDPMRCWSLKFNGLLRRGAREESAAGDEGADEEGAPLVFHARLDLLWQAIHYPVDSWEESSPRPLAHALAGQPDASLEAFLCEAGEGYDQWGALHGEVRLLPGSEPQVWYLRGPRQHRWGLNATPDRALASFMYFNNGEMCSIHGHISCNTQYVAGYVQGTGGLLKPITWTDLSLGKREEDTKILGNNLLIKISGGGRMQEVWQQLCLGASFFSGDSWSQRHTCHRTHVASNHSYGWGITIFSDRYIGPCPSAERKSLPVVEVPRLALTEEAPLVLTLDDPLCRNSDLTGGKGSSLAFLAAYRRLLPSDQVPYEVPKGLVLTTAAWIQQLQSSSDLQQAVKAVRQAVRAVQQVDGAVQQAVGATHLNHLKDACSRAVEVCQRVPVCAVVMEALLAVLRQHFGPDDCRLAVRSSSCGEDGEETCAAGQNKTVLGVRGDAHLLQALSLCWASNFSFRSVEYRRQHGQEAEEVGVAVVVQEMVEASSAGVMFSIDPVTGSPDAVTVTANFGLGESVVSASAEPDTIVVRRSWTDRLSLASATLGTKMTKCVMQEEGGTVEVEVTPEERGLQCLSEAMALRLAGLAVFLEKAFAGPRDLEFAVAQEKVYLLQARPITSLNAWTDYEIIHEQDTALITDNEVITTSNTGEVFPGATKPLTLSTVLPALNLAFQRTTKNDHRPTRRLHYNSIPCTTYYSHVFLDILQMSYWTKGVTLMNRAFDLQLHGCEVTTPEFVEWGLERMADHSYAHWTLALAFEVYNLLKVPGLLRSSKSQFGQYHLDCDRAGSASSLYVEITRRLPHLQQISKTHMNTSRLSSATQTIAFLILANGKQEFSEENKSDIATMLASSGAESADVPTALKGVSQLLSESEDVDEFLALTPDEGHVWLQSHPGDVGEAFRDFLFRHGHRCIKEFDLGSVSWGLDPGSLVHTLQMMVRKPGVSTNRNHLTVQEALDSLRSPVSHNTKRSLEFVLPPCRKAVHHREASKSLLIKVVDGFRRAYRKLGELMVSECRLPSPDLVFYLKHPELGRLLDSPSPSLITKAVRRRRLHSHLEQLKFPRIVIGLPKPIVAGEEGGGGGRSVQILTGTPVCNGLVTAPARVINDLKDAPTIQGGDVLVTFSTDVGWTPYFPLLSGVITEIGGLVSHGAVVAREYGLPCVVGVTAATHILKSGEMIELNAVRGTITRLRESDGGSSDNSNRESNGE